MILLITAIGVSCFLQNVGRLGEPVAERLYPTYPPFPAFNRRIDGRDERLLGQVDPVVIVSPFVLLALQFLVYRTKLGVAIRAVAEDHPTASLMGINVNRIISVRSSWRGTMLAAAAGFLYGLKYEGQAKQTADTMW